jgi:hypothetical protein
MHINRFAKNLKVNDVICDPDPQSTDTGYYEVTKIRTIDMGSVVIVDVSSLAYNWTATFQLDAEDMVILRIDPKRD